MEVVRSEPFMGANPKLPDDYSNRALSRSQNSRLITGLPRIELAGSDLGDGREPLRAEGVVVHNGDGRIEQRQCKDDADPAKAGAKAGEERGAEVDADHRQRVRGEGLKRQSGRIDDGQLLIDEDQRDEREDRLDEKRYRRSNGA